MSEDNTTELELRVKALEECVWALTKTLAGCREIGLNKVYRLTVLVKEQIGDEV